MIAKLTLKKLLTGFCHNTGALAYLRKLKQRKSAFILTYHRVLDSPADESVFVQPGMYVTTVAFRHQMEFIRENFNVIPLAELVKRIATGISVGGCCAITFDDGWRDNYINAFPVLREFKLPATIFLATGYIGTNRLFWPEEFTYYLRQPEVRASTAKSPTLKKLIDEVPHGDAEDFLDSAINAMKYFTPNTREEILDQLRHSGSRQPQTRFMMNWEEVEVMQASGLICFGAHTAEHLILDQVPARIAEEDIARSRQAIENRLGVCPEFFSYPNGNFTDDMKNILKRQGFKGAVATRKGWIGKDTDLFDIPRIGIHQDISCTIPLFLARITLNRF